MGGMKDAGPVFTQFRHDAKGAVRALSEAGGGVAIAALHHPDIGDIDLRWGSTSDDERAKGQGLAKLIRWHPEVLRDLQGFLSRLHVHQRHARVIHLRADGGERAAVRVELDGQSRRWLLTAYVQGRNKVGASKGFPAALDSVNGPDSATPNGADGSILMFDAAEINPAGERMQPPLIRYNLKDRGRQHTGQARNFNLRAIADAINSPATQETVASRGMLGYYGHAPRVRYGLAPVEGGFEGGKYKAVQPAIVTTYLRADYDGNVEHRTEFLDTEDGALAAKLWAGKIGGFSSAIDERAPAFYGFDYVAQPNYLGNSFRNVVMDGVQGEAGITYDSVYVAEQTERAGGHAIAAMLDHIDAERRTASAVIERLTLENEALLSAMAASGRDANAVLDSMAPVRGMVLSVDAAQRMRADRRFFFDSALPALQPLPKAETGEAPDYAAELLLRRHGRG